MGLDFTKSQKDALKLLTHDTLVSAGAGSGKTRVLTERIARIIESGVSPLNILVLTFTKNAANEMKTRVKKRLKNSSPKTLNLLEQADISTIDSFVMNTVKKYFYKLNIRADVNIIDSNVLSMQKSLILDDIFNELYEDKDPVFLNYIRNFTDKNDDYIKSYFMDLINKVELDIDLDDFLSTAFDTYTSTDFKMKAQDYVITILKGNMSNLLCYLEEFEHMTDIDAYRNACITQIDLLKNVIKSDDYFEYQNFSLQFSLGAKKKGEKDNEEATTFKKKKVEKYFKKAKSILDLAPTLDELVDNYLVNSDYISLYIKVLKEFFNRLNKFKDLNNAYDFADLSKKLYKLLLTDNDVKRELSDKYQYILLDEYQDTSDIQEGILKLISHNNMYMVGDIKQSIYRFRNANPDIFKDKYNTFKKIDDDLSLTDGVRIDMIENFRSRSEVLDDINKIFRPLMTLDYGDCNYTCGHEMVFGNKTYDDYKFLNDHNMDIFTYNIPEEDAEGNKIEYPFNEAEIEAFKVARDIKTKMDAKYMVLDEKPRIARYSDFCIIVDKEKNYDTYKKIFEYMGIPLSVIQDVKMTTSDTTMVLTNVLKLITLAKSSFKDPNYTHAFMSIARSFLYSLDDSYIFNLIKNNNLDNEISLIAIELNKLIDVESNSNIYLKALNEFNFFKTISTTNNITNKEHEAEYIYNSILSLDSINYSLSDIVTYFEECQSQELDIKYKLDHNEEDAVKLMNIHKSKGLEFPICYFIGLSENPNLSDERVPIFDKEFGFTTLTNKDEDGEYYKSLNSLFITEKTKKARKSERLRLFYVALTRAKEKMIFITKDFTESDILVKDDITTFRDYLAYDYKFSTDTFDMFIKPFELDELGLTPNYQMIKKMGERTNYNVVPDYELNTNKEEIKKDRISKNITNVLSKEELDSIDLGLRLHEIFESLDFSNIDLDEYNLSDFEKNIVSKVLSNPLFRSIKEAKTYKEHEFKFILDDTLYNGIIDLLVVYNDHIDIIDYKLSDISKSEYERQLNLYKEYVKSKSDLPIRCYLLSILKNEIKEVLV